MFTDIKLFLSQGLTFVRDSENIKLNTSVYKEPVACFYICAESAKVLLRHEKKRKKVCEFLNEFQNCLMNYRY